MKKKFFVLMVFVLLIGLLSGCEDDIQEFVQTSPEIKVSQQSVKDNTVSQTEVVAPIETTQEFITKEKALEIALEKAGLNRDAVTLIKTELDYDDGIKHYDVEFRQGKYEYDIEIKADDGTIISFEKDIDD